MTLMWCTRARGFTPSVFRPLSLTTIRPLAPSQIWLAVAAVQRPPSAISLTLAMLSNVASWRMPSSVVRISPVSVPSTMRTATGTISRPKWPALVAAIAR